MKPSELELEVADAAYVPADDTDTEEQMHADLLDGIDLLKRAKVLMEFVADYDMCVALSKRERDALVRLASRVDDYLDDMDASYEGGA